uniref:Uncharacterized protein n=1 Tax=Accipiter nisus TaxID=211598 RepID=A0A8B9MG87_9AVES
PHIPLAFSTGLEGQDETCVIKHRMEDMASWGEPGYHNLRTLRLEVTSAVTWRKKSYYKLGSVTNTLGFKQMARTNGYKLGCE